MIGQVITKEVEENGVKVLIPVDGQGNKLSQSAYQPSQAILDLFSKCMRDYQVSYNLQHRPFDYFDGLSLLERTRLDQRTFGAYVGAEYVPQNKKWRWKGRKNTARNKLIGIAAHMISGMLFPTVFAQDDQDQEQKMMARVMSLQVEHWLRKAKYEINFLFAVVSALVCPAVFVQVEWIEAMQTVKGRLEDGTITIQQAVDESMSGLNLNIRPVDEVLLGDMYTFDMQRQPHLCEVQRVSWDSARKQYAGCYFDKDGKDLFDYVQAGKTRIVMASQEKQTLFDVEWTEADGDFVQVLTFKYKSEDLEVKCVGGVFMINGDTTAEIYSSNSFKHRRQAELFDAEGNPSWGSVPVYNIAKSGYEPLDPYKRFAYYKSGAFKEYWEDDSINHAYRLLQDGMTLDVLKPVIISGVSKVDGTVIAPSAVTTMPADAKASPYSLGPNLSAAMQVLRKNEEDMSESTLDPILQGQLGMRQTAYAVNAAMSNAKIMLGNFSLMIADLVTQVGDLTVDLILQNCTVGSIDLDVPGALGLKYKSYLIQSKENGKAVTHKIVYTDRYYGKEMTAHQIRDREYELWMLAGGKDNKGSQRITEVSPYAALRMRYAAYVDADQIVERSIGGDQQRKRLAFDMLTDPRVAPFTDPKLVAEDFVIDEYGGNDPERYKRKGQPQPGNEDMMNAIMGNGSGDSAPQGPPPQQQRPMLQRSTKPAGNGSVVPNNLANLAVN